MSDDLPADNRVECDRCGGTTDPAKTLPFHEFYADTGRNPVLCPGCRNELVRWIDGDEVRFDEDERRLIYSAIKYFAQTGEDYAALYEKVSPWYLNYDGGDDDD